MINCTQCTHYQHNADQHICDAGIFDIRIFGKAFIYPEQEECACSDIKKEETVQVRRGRPAKA